MRKCPKCQLVYQDESRICRACGAILDEVADVAIDEPPAVVEADDRPATVDDVFGEPLAPIDLADAVALQPAPTADDWVCTDCGEAVPAAFDICWNCESAALAQPPSDSPTAEVIDGQSLTTANSPGAVSRRCLTCGSDMLLEGVTVLDQGQSSSGTLNLVVHGNPEAFLFKESLYGQLVADVCGACGHVELRVTNPAEVFERFQRSRQ